MIAELNPPGPVLGGKRKFDPAVAGWSSISAVPEGGVYYQYMVNGEAADGKVTFTVQAQGDVDIDGDPSYVLHEWHLQGTDWALMTETEWGDDW